MDPVLVHLATMASESDSCRKTIGIANSTAVRMMRIVFRYDDSVIHIVVADCALVCKHHSLRRLRPVHYLAVSMIRALSCIDSPSRLVTRIVTPPARLNEKTRGSNLLCDWSEAIPRIYCSIHVLSHLRQRPPQHHPLPGTWFHPFSFYLPGF